MREGEDAKGDGVAAGKDEPIRIGARHRRRRADPGSIAERLASPSPSLQRQSAEKRGSRDVLPDQSAEVVAVLRARVKDAFSSESPASPVLSISMEPLK